MQGNQQETWPWQKGTLGIRGVHINTRQRSYLHTLKVNMSWFSIMLGTLSKKGPKQCSVWQRWCLKPTDVLPPFIVYNAQGTLPKESRYAAHNLHHGLAILAAQYKETNRGNLNAFFLSSTPKAKSSMLRQQIVTIFAQLTTLKKQRLKWKWGERLPAGFMFTCLCLVQNW